MWPNLTYIKRNTLLTLIRVFIIETVKFAGKPRQFSWSCRIFSFNKVLVNCHIAYLHDLKILCWHLHITNNFPFCRRDLGVHFLMLVFISDEKHLSLHLMLPVHKVGSKYILLSAKKIKSQTYHNQLKKRKLKYKHGRKRWWVFI